MIWLPVYVLDGKADTCIVFKKCLSSKNKLFYKPFFFCFPICYHSFLVCMIYIICHEEIIHYFKANKVMNYLKKEEFLSHLLRQLFLPQYTEWRK